MMVTAASHAGTSRTTHKRNHFAIDNLEITHPLSSISTMVFIIAMLLYPLMTSISNYRIGQDAALRVTSNAALQLDLTQMHLFADIIACLWGAWAACRACAAHSMIRPPWSGGSPVRAYGIPMLKGSLICAVTYLLAVTPAMVQTLLLVDGPPPVGAALMGMAVPATMFSLGYALGVICASRWATVPALLISATICVGGMLLTLPRIPEGRTAERAWGSPWATALPIMSTGLGSEPGISINPWAVVVRIALSTAIMGCAFWSCTLIAQHWGTMKRLWLTVVSLAVSLALPAALCTLVGLAGPSPWLRSKPFTPVCSPVGGNITVCSHPNDSTRRQTYLLWMKSVASWFAAEDANGNSAMNRTLGTVVLLGNAFTPTEAEAATGHAWHVTEQGEIMIRNAGDDVVQMMTDTVTERTSEYSDLSDLTTHIANKALQAPCSQEAFAKVMDDDALSDGASVTAFVRVQLPYRMRADAYAQTGGGTGGTRSGGAQDKAAQLLSNASDDDFREFVRNNLDALRQCQVTPQQVLYSSLAETHR